MMTAKELTRKMNNHEVHTGSQPFPSNSAMIISQIKETTEICCCAKSGSSRNIVYWSKSWLKKVQPWQQKIKHVWQTMFRTII